MGLENLPVHYSIRGFLPQSEIRFPAMKMPRGTRPRGTYDTVIRPSLLQVSHMLEGGMQCHKQQRRCHGGKQGIDEAGREL